MTEIFEYFSANRCLFKCDIHGFDEMIKTTMNKLIISDVRERKYFTFCVSDQDLHTKCAICLQNVGIINRLIICYNCCNMCINKKVIINLGMFNIYTIMYYNNKYNVYQIIDVENYNYQFAEFCSYYQQDTKNKILDHFIENSPKLRDRFYHVAPVIFLLSLSDPASQCYVLNDDVMFYILKLIY